MHADLDHPHAYLTLDFIVLLLGRALLLLADPTRSQPSHVMKGPNRRARRGNGSIYPKAEGEASLAS